MGVKARRRSRFGRRLPWRKIKPNRTYLEAYEARIILRDLIQLSDGTERRISPSDMMRSFPMRYDSRYLPRALKRMEKQGLIRAQRGSLRRWRSYYVPGIEGVAA